MKTICPHCGSDDIGEVITFHCFNCARKFSALEMMKAREYTWDEIKPDDAGDYIEIRPGVYRRKRNELPKM